jgi:arginase family enzyme
MIAGHLNLDDAWEERVLGLRCFDARQWGPRLRYFAPQKVLEEFYRTVLAPLPPFVVYGSGDFHHLTGWLVKKVAEPVTVVSFDNHPDWDCRPPRWSCGGWVNRALEWSHVEKCAVWGCGNFELEWPGRMFGNRRALRSGRLEIHGWAERFSAGARRRFSCMTRENWRERFQRFAEGLSGQAIYVTVDLDCLRAEEAATNWENGLFDASDVAWAMGRLRELGRVMAGDVCGAYSKPLFERWTQKLAGWWDHPKIASVSEVEANSKNAESLHTIWSALCGAKRL